MSLILGRGKSKTFGQDMAPKIQNGFQRPPEIGFGCSQIPGITHELVITGKGAGKRIP